MWNLGIYFLTEVNLHGPAPHVILEYLIFLFCSSGALLLSLILIPSLFIHVPTLYSRV
jgi:hypothetical protein